MTSDERRLRVMTIVGTRPELIRLSRIINKLDQNCDHILVHTGQNYDHELSEVFFEQLEIPRPDYYLNAAGQNASVTIGNCIVESDRVMRDERPDAVLILGDTNSALAAISAKRLKIPLFHMEAGNRCFDERVPEEINRRIVDHIADINLTYSDIAREYLLREGLPPDRVIKTGSPMAEVLAHYADGISRSTIVEELKLNRHEYFVVSFHREENVDSDRNFGQFCDLLKALADWSEQPVVVSTHPRTRKRLDSWASEFPESIRFLNPLGFFDYVRLQADSRVVLSDSGTITEESNILDFPALNLRSSHERPEGMEEAAVMMVGLAVDRILQAITILDQQPRGSSRSTRLVRDYETVNVSDKVLRLLHSYTDYVNRVVWQKH